MGIAAFPHTASEQDELVFAADRALISALARGNHVCLASIPLEPKREGDC
jgi:predicted signal transduction protein with EAL and GGDEF domain